MSNLQRTSTFKSSYTKSHVKHKRKFKITKNSSRKLPSFHILGLSDKVRIVKPIYKSTTMNDRAKHENEYTNDKRKFNADGILNEITCKNRPDELSLNDDGRIEKPAYESTRMDNCVRNGNEYTNKKKKFNTDGFLNRITYNNQPDENKYADCLEKNGKSNGNVFIAESDDNKNTIKHYQMNKVQCLKLNDEPVRPPLQNMERQITMADILFELKNQREEHDKQIMQINKNMLECMTQMNQVNKNMSEYMTQTNKNMSDLAQQHAKSIEQAQVTNTSLTAILQRLIEKKN